MMIYADGNCAPQLEVLTANSKPPFQRRTPFVSGGHGVVSLSADWRVLLHF